MQKVKSEATRDKAEARVRGHNNLKVIEVEFIPTPEADGRLSGIYDVLLSGQGHKDADQGT